MTIIVVIHYFIYNSFDLIIYIYIYKWNIKKKNLNSSLTHCWVLKKLTPLLFLIKNVSNIQYAYNLIHLVHISVQRKVKNSKESKFLLFYLWIQIFCKFLIQCWWQHTFITTIKKTLQLSNLLDLIITKWRQNWCNFGNQERQSKKCTMELCRG